MNEKISFNEFLQKISELKLDGEGIGYCAVVDLKVLVNIWVHTQENETTLEVTPHINFGAGELDEYRTYACIMPYNDEDLKTSEQIIKHLKDFGVDTGIDVNAPLWYEDEGFAG